MGKNNSISDKDPYNDEVLQALLRDPTRSDQEIAKSLKTYRQRILRKRRKFENEKIVWGYTAVVDHNKLNYAMYLILAKTQPLSEEIIHTMLRRLEEDAPIKQNMRILDVLYVSGKYDWIITFSARNHATAKRYYDSIRLAYKDFLLEKPVMVDINFPLVREGKNNPELGKLHDFVSV